eukprot:COSAG06_NODE_29553_length_554_cov_1.127473_1_plen_26_part_01
MDDMPPAKVLLSWMMHKTQRATEMPV